MSMPHHQETAAEKTERLRCYFSLLGENEQGFWVESKGLSMLPLFYRGIEVHIDTNAEHIEIGDIVVFHRSNKFIAHRLIGFDQETQRYMTKGDTLFYFDGPSAKEEFLGKVDRLRRKAKVRRVERDKDLAELSAKLGRKLQGKLRWLPDWLKFIYYFSFAIPGYARIRLQKTNNSKNRWN